MCFSFCIICFDFLQKVFYLCMCYLICMAAEVTGCFFHFKTRYHRKLRAYCYFITLFSITDLWANSRTMLSKKESASAAAFKSFLHLTSHFDKNSLCFPHYLIQTFLYIFLPSISLTCSFFSSLNFLHGSGQTFPRLSLQLPASLLQTSRLAENLKKSSQLSKRSRSVALHFFLFTKISQALSWFK